MRRTFYSFVLLGCLLQSPTLPAQTEQSVRDISADLELLLDEAINEQQPVAEQSAITQFLTALAEFNQDALNTLYDRDALASIQVSYPISLPANAAVIYSIALPESLVHLVQRDSAIQIYQVEVSQERLARSIRYYLQELQISSSFNGMERGSSELYRWIAQPYLDDLREAGIQDLVFITTDTLRPLPLSTLFDGRRYLVDDFSVTVSLGGVVGEGLASGLPELPSDAGFEITTLRDELVLSQSRRLVDSRNSILPLLSNHLPTRASTNLVSLWPGSTAAREQLVDSMTSALEDGAEHAAALRAAQLQLKSSSRFGHPYYWGSYLLVQ